VCDQCLPGTYTPGKGYVTCLNCDAGKSSLAKESTCKDCVAGKYAFPACSQCENCDWNTKSQLNHSNSMLVVQGRAAFECSLFDYEIVQTCYNKHERCSF
jgi:hypothetical protein